MATFFQGETIGYWSSTSNYLYGTLTGDVNRDGNTVTISNMSLSITSRYSSTGTSSFSFTVNGQTNTASFSPRSSTTIGTMSIPGSSFTAGASETSRSVGWSSSDGNSGSFTVTFPSGTEAPSTPTVSILSKTYNSATFRVSISSYGNPSAAAGRLIEAAILSSNNYYSVPRRWQHAADVTSADITVDNSSSTGSTPMTITGNTKYWYGGFANNTQLTSYTVAGEFYTPCPPLTSFALDYQEYASATTVKATFAWTRASDGGASTRTGYYRVSSNGGAYGNWVSIGTVTATSGSFSAIVPTGSTAKVQMKLATAAGGDSRVSTVTFTPSPTGEAPASPTTYANTISESQIDVVYGTTSFGTPSTGKITLYGDASTTPTKVLASKTTTGNSTYSHTGLEPNTRYAYQSIAENGLLSTSSGIAGVYTWANLTNFKYIIQTYDKYNQVSATFSWARSVDGNALTRTGYYRVSLNDGASYGEWVSLGTIANNITSGTFKVLLPTDTQAKVQMKICVGSSSNGKILTASVTTNVTHTAPVFSAFDYTDTNPATLALTKDDQVFIQSQSQPRVTILAKDKATANDGADITGYTASLNALSIQIAYDEEDVSGTFEQGTPTASGSLALTVSANDSIGLATAVSKEVTVAPWTEPTLVASIARVNNFESTSTLKIAGTWSPVVVAGTVRNTLACAYRSKRSSDSEWGEWVNRPITITDEEYSATDLSLTFDNTYQWDVQVRIVDAFATTTQDLSLPVGIPIFFISKNNKISINRKPTNYSADIDVNGLIYSQDQPVMVSHVGQIIMSTTLTTADDVKALYGGSWTAYSGFSVSGLYCWRRVV